MNADNRVDALGSVGSYIDVNNHQRNLKLKYGPRFRMHQLDHLWGSDAEFAMKTRHSSSNQDLSTVICKEKGLHLHPTQAQLKGKLTCYSRGRYFSC